MNRTEYAEKIAAAFTGEYAFQVYNRIALDAADATVFGFVVNGILYAATTEVTSDMLSCERTSTARGGFEKIRIRLSAKRKAILRNSATACGKWDEIKKAMQADEKKTLNDGHVFEKYLTIQAGQAWKADTVPFWKDGDLNIGGRKYQIKFDGAEFSTYTNIRNAIAATAGA